MPTTPPSITALPTPPDPNDRATFNTRAYPWSVAQQTLATQVGDVATNVYNNALDAAGSAVSATDQVTLATEQAVLAQTAANSASATVGATQWVSGTTYAVGDCVWSPINQQVYRRKIAGAGTTDPSADNTNWTQVGGGSSKILRSTRTSNVQLTTADNGNLIDITGGTFTQTFAAAATLGDGWFCYLRNSGTGTVTLDPNGSETIDGVVSGVIRPGMAILIQCDGGAFHCVRIGTQIAMEVLTSGTTWTCPLGVRTAKTTGTGGGGSGGKSSSGSAAAGGSGAGTFIKQVRLTPGTAYTYAIGSGGASQATAGVAGNNGGNTTFNDGITTCTATGGVGGSFNAAMTNSFTAGSQATNGDINIRGGWGLSFASSASTSCGNSFLGANIGTAGATGDGYGSGGAGGTSSLSSGAGAPGVIVLEY